VRIDRVGLLYRVAAAITRERERRQAAERAEAEAAWQRLLDKIEDMARKFVALPRAGDEELAAQIARAEGWARVDALRMPADLARAEAVALCWTVDREAATRLLGAFWSAPDPPVPG
jgi:hypothetical protein